MSRLIILVRTVALVLAIGAAGTPVLAQIPDPLPTPTPTPTPTPAPTPTPTPPPPPALDKLDPLLHALASQTTGSSRVIVRALDAASMGAVALLIQQAGGTLGRPLPILEAQAAEVPNASLAALSNSSIVRKIASDRLTLGATDLAERTAVTVGAAAARLEFGYDGAGIGVAVIDSGVTSWHDDLTDLAMPGSQRVDQFVDFVNGSPAPYDDYGHGTHVAGIIAGNGFDSGGARAGAAPAARLIALKVLDGSGRGRISDVIAALDYCVTYKDPLNIRVINLSVGAGVYESYNSDLLTLAAKRAVDQGIVVVAAVGNSGRDSYGRTRYGAVTAPGNAPWVLTVGASSHMGTIDRFDDTIAPFSSRGPTSVDGIAKPDLVAPGVGTESLSDPNSALYASLSPYLLSGTVATSYLPYLSLSGTSQAAPVVAGTVALMLQANPALTPNAVKAILQYTAQVYAGYDALTQGAGFLNARGSVELARFLAAPSADPYPSDPSWSGQVIWGNKSVRGGRLDSTASAWSTDVDWGAATSSTGANVVWGVICSTTDCETSGAWAAWGATCTDNTCTTIAWDGGNSENVVWGSECGGADCHGTVWHSSDGGEMVVWGTSDDDMVVWGTSDDGDMVVWGTSCYDPSCQPVVWGQ